MTKNAMQKASILSIFILLIYTGFRIDFNAYEGFDFTQLVLMFAVGGIMLFKLIRKDRDEQAGMATEDELSEMINYKAGYYAFEYSAYLWVVIFFYMDKFPDTHTMLIFGMIISGVIRLISHFIVTYKLRGK